MRTLDERLRRAALAGALRRPGRRLRRSSSTTPWTCSGPASRSDPSAVALTYFDGSITRQELDELSDGLASGLLANGFQPGDRLAVYLQNVPQFVIAMVAAWKAGGVMVSINPMSRQRELSYLLKDSGATVLVSLEALYDEIGRTVVPDTDVRLVLTTSELEFQTRNDERLFAGMSAGSATRGRRTSASSSPSTAAPSRRRCSWARTTSRS